MSFARTLKSCSIMHIQHHCQPVISLTNPLGSFQLTSWSSPTCRDNFKIMFSSTEGELTVFGQLEKACIKLMELSSLFKSHDASQAKYRSVYSHMLWSKSV